MRGREKAYIYLYAFWKKKSSGGGLGQNLVQHLTQSPAHLPQLSFLTFFLSVVLLSPPVAFSPSLHGSPKNSGSSQTTSGAPGSTQGREQGQPPRSRRAFPSNAWI
jgi:hypothetical protein